MYSLAKELAQLATLIVNDCATDDGIVVAVSHASKTLTILGLNCQSAICRQLWYNICHSSGMWHVATFWANIL